MQHMLSSLLGAVVVAVQYTDCVRTDCVLYGHSATVYYMVQVCRQFSSRSICSCSKAVYMYKIK